VFFWAPPTQDELTKVAFDSLKKESAVIESKYETLLNKYEASAIENSLMEREISKLKGTIDSLGSCKKEKAKVAQGETQ
jgi:hypothetical protein